MKLDETEAAQRFSASRVARLATVDEHGRPHLVPVVFAVHGSVLVVAVDDKPKSGRNLKRLRNIEANPAVSILVDEYAEDWSRLWWVRADGQARVVRDEVAMREPIDWLVAKYPQYQQMRPAGPVIWIEVRRWTGWAP